MGAVVGMQERYSSLAPLYYRGASAATVVYDITNAETFKKARFWVKELQKHANPGIIIALVGNKSDMSAAREVPFEVSVSRRRSSGVVRQTEVTGARVHVHAAVVGAAATCGQCGMVWAGRFGVWPRLRLRKHHRLPLRTHSGERP